MSRRWTANQIRDLSGVRTRVVPGTKFPGDLRIEWWTGHSWRPIDMEAVFYLVDFFSENEEARREHMGHWRIPGDTYFLNECHAAVRDGWQVPSRRIVEQRRRRDVA